MRGAIPLMRDVDTLSSHLQKLQALLRAPLPGMASVEGQQRAKVTKTTLDPPLRVRCHPTDLAPSPPR